MEALTAAMDTSLSGTAEKLHAEYVKEDAVREMLQGLCDRNLSAVDCAFINREGDNALYRAFRTHKVSPFALLIHSPKQSWSA